MRQPFGIRLSVMVLENRVLASLDDPEKAEITSQSAVGAVIWVPVTLNVSITVEKCSQRLPCMMTRQNYPGKKPSQHPSVLEYLPPLE